MNGTELKEQNESSRKKSRGRDYAFFCPIFFAIGIICILTRYVLCYLCGYYQTSFALMSWNYNLAFFGLLSLLALFAVWMESLCRRKRVLWTTIMFLALLSVSGLKYIIPWPHDMVPYGLKNGMLKHYGADEMRAFAADFDKLPNLPDTIPPFSKVYDNRHAIHQLAGTGLKEKYPFLDKCEFLRQRGNTICVNWGGFDNHWGFCITTDGSRVEPNIAWDGGKIIYVGDDIYFFSEY